MLPMIRALVANGYGQFKRSTLLMNSIYLMLGTVSVAVFGFAFWVIVTRSYPSDVVGMTATLLSVSGLISMLGLVGFDTTFVRFLPHSQRRRDDHISTGIILVAVMSGLLALAFIVLMPLVSPSLAFVTHDSMYAFGFIFFTVVTSLNTLTNAIFLAFKSARDILIINILFSALKVALPLLIVKGGSMTIFVLVGISQLVGLILSLVILRAQLGYIFRFHIHLDFLRYVKKYSSSVYISSILNLLPPTLLPLIIVHQIGAASAAYYYIAFTIATTLYTISYASMQSAFAEGSHNQTEMKAHIQKAIKLIGVLLTPAIIMVVGLSGFILRIFGGEYASEGRTLLQLFAISAFGVAAYSTMGTIFKVAQHLRGVIIMNIVYAGIILGVSYLFVPRFGVMAIGWAWLLGNVASAFVGFIFLRTRPT
jgi:O-antigen/teichoic acid export membrane protein